MEIGSLTRSLQEFCCAIQELVLAPSDLVIHRTQCCSLAKSYAVGLHAVIERVEEALSVCWPEYVYEHLLPSLVELYHGMVQGKQFIGKCLQRDDWVKRTVVLALSREAVDVCLHDLIWCICVIDQAVEQVLPPLQIAREGAGEEIRHLHSIEFLMGESLEKGLEKKHDIYTRLNSLWADVSEEEDLAILSEALKHKVVEYESSISGRDVSEYRLAKFMLQKLSSGNLEHANADEGLPACLWVDPVEFEMESIGGGAFAVVYEVEWWGNTLGLKEFLDVDEISFGREAVIQARLRHPNLVQLICCTAKPLRKKCGLVMELMDMNLNTLINDQRKDGRETPFSLVTAVDIMLQIAKGMEYLHSLGIMHRDLKSFNVLISKPTPCDCLGNCSGNCSMRAKIADFGLSKARYRSARFTTLHTGTTRWMAPEVFETLPENDFQNQPSAKYTMKADVYSFAMVCYEILTGKIPFDDGGRLTELHQRLLRGVRPQLPSSCPTFLASYVQRCWHGDPIKRPSFAQISRTLRHLKGILLTGPDPLSSSALSGQSCSFIEEKVSEIISPDWVSSSRAFTLRSMTMLFEMSLYKMMMERYMICQQEEHNHVKRQSKQGIEKRSSSESKMWSLNRMRLGRKSGKFSLFDDEYCFDDTEEVARGGSHATRSFTLKELNAATNQFSDRIGSLDYFRGTLANGKCVAVRVMRVDHSPSKGIFVAEMKTHGGIRHPNIVPLFGFCTEKGCLMLVYEHMTRGDLAHYLFEQRQLSLYWPQKYKIVCGLASALHHLHVECKPRVLHRDVDPSNVLLDEDYNARLGGFNFAVLMHESSHVTARALCGAPWYIAPEYFKTGIFTSAADVYSFGVVALELASGRRCLDLNYEDGKYLTQFVWELYEAGRLLEAGDKNLALAGDMEEKQMKCLLQLGLACIQMDPKNRPTIGFVVLVLSGVLPPPIPAQPGRLASVLAPVHDPFSSQSTSLAKDLVANH